MRTAGSLAHDLPFALPRCFAMPCSVLAHFGPLSHGKAASFTPPTSGGARLPDVFTGLLSSLLPKGSAAVRQNLAEAGVPEAPLKASDAVTDQVAPPTADTVLTARAPTATAVPGGKAPVGKVQADGGIGRKPTHETLGRSGGSGQRLRGTCRRSCRKLPLLRRRLRSFRLGFNLPR